MGQKVNPIGFRLNISEQWQSYFSSIKNYANNIRTDLIIRDFLENLFSKMNITTHKIIVKKFSHTFFVDIFVDNKTLPIKQPNTLISILDSDSFNNKDYIYKNFMQDVIGSLEDILNNKYKIVCNFYKINSLKITQKDSNKYIYKDFRIFKVFNDKELNRFKKQSYYQYLIEALYQTILLKNTDILAKTLASIMSTNRRHRAILTAMQKICTIFTKHFDDIYGIKIKLNGRINGAPRAKHISIVTGSTPLQTLSKNIQYSNTTVYTHFGTCGLKIWIAFK